LFICEKEYLSWVEIEEKE
jgi:hypothetical protein